MRPRRPASSPVPESGPPSASVGCGRGRRGGSGSCSGARRACRRCARSPHTLPNRASSVPTASMCTTLVASSGPWKRFVRKRTWPICAPSPASSASCGVRFTSKPPPGPFACARAPSSSGGSVHQSHAWSGDGLELPPDPRVRPTEDRMRILLARRRRNAMERRPAASTDCRTSCCRRPARRRRVRWANASCEARIASRRGLRRWRARRTAELALAKRADARVRPGTDGTGRNGGTWKRLLASEIRERDRAPVALARSAGRPCSPAPAANRHRCWSAHGRRSNAPRPVSARTRRLLVVAHDAVNRVLLCRARHPLSRLWNFCQAPATLNLLRRRGRRSLRRGALNDAGHHTALFGEAVHRARQEPASALQDWLARLERQHPRCHRPRPLNAR